ncbi:MAG: terpene cyclase/mutase family protein [Pirellulales bacterium]|nr:terpene cyclase/mutase family protein [Pirellulales bacterium]
MPSELSSPSETPPATSPEVEMRGDARCGRWRDEPVASKPSRATIALSRSITADSVIVAASRAAFWRVAQWERIFAPRDGTNPWILSTMVHCAAIIVLGLLIAKPDTASSPAAINLTAVQGLTIGGEELLTDADVAPTPFAASSEALVQSLAELPIEPLEFAASESIDAQSVTIPVVPRSLTGATPLSFADHGTNWGVSISNGGGLNGRSRGMRGKLAGQGGGSHRSEEAVERGLKWLLAHQHEDGSWRFSFDGLPCNSACRNAGTETTSTGATALALLPFYGAGYTHREGPYAEQVNKGLYYLCNRMLILPQGGDLQEGTMYAQALSTIVLCEAYAMSQDAKLRPYAEKAVKFVLYAQDLHGGGWRYTPGMPGDTTMTGWQLMALKSAVLAGLDVPRDRFYLAGKFLDSVQSERGAAYGYRTTIKRPCTSAVGLLCRMYLGWPKTHPAIREGVRFFDRQGPSPTDLYLDYYASQLMFHHGSAPWERWNKKMREYLIQTQANQGHEAGSWHFDDQHGNAGGRLYSTAMAILTLEVYYRYLPIYSSRVVDDGF